MYGYVAPHRLKEEKQKGVELMSRPTESAAFRGLAAWEAAQARLRKGGLVEADYDLAKRELQYKLIEDNYLVVLERLVEETGLTVEGIKDRLYLVETAILIEEGMIS